MSEPEQQFDDVLRKPDLKDGIIPEPQTSPKPKTDELPKDGDGGNAPRDFASSADEGGG